MDEPGLGKGRLFGSGDSERAVVEPKVGEVALATSWSPARPEPTALAGGKAERTAPVT